MSVHIISQWMYSKSLSPAGLLADVLWGSMGSQQLHLLSFEICCIFNDYDL